MYTWIYGEKRGDMGIECKYMIASWEQNIISYHSNLLECCIYFWTFLNTIKLFSSVKLSEPNNKFSIEITVYGVILIINCILAFVYSNIVERHICQKSQYNDHRKVRILQPLKSCFVLFCFVLCLFVFLFFVFFMRGGGYVFFYYYY